MLPEAAITPPLGLITVAALCPASWSLRLLDHAVDNIRDADYQWADLVMVSSMHAQRADTHAVLARARELGRRTQRADLALEAKWPHQNGSRRCPNASRRSEFGQTNVDATAPGDPQVRRLRVGGAD